MSDTPRTDKEAIGFARLLVDHAPTFRVMELVRADFARELERELNAAPQAATGTVPPESSAPAVAAPQASAKQDTSPQVSHTGGCRSIESAPKDAHGIIAYSPKFYQDKGGWVAAVWVEGGWHSNPGGWRFEPTHWMPMPEKPC